MHAVGGCSCPSSVETSYWPYADPGPWVSTRTRYRYEYHHNATLEAGFAISVWDDFGKFRVLNRTSMQWDAPVVEALGCKP